MGDGRMGRWGGGLGWWGRWERLDDHNLAITIVRTVMHDIRANGDARTVLHERCYQQKPNKKITKSPGKSPPKAHQKPTKAHQSPPKPTTNPPEAHSKPNPGPPPQMPQGKFFSKGSRPLAQDRQTDRRQTDRQTERNFCS